MRVTKAGIYVMIKAFGVEGLLTEADGQTIVIDTDKEVAIVNGSIEVRTFDTLKIEVVPTSVEFRRKINFVFIEKVNTSLAKKNIESQMEVDENQSLADAKRSKKKKKPQ